VLLVIYHGEQLLGVMVLGVILEEWKFLKKVTLQIEE
jgi:hypothetical protein